MVTNEIGKPENSYQYSPFGSLINGEGDSVNALRFVGRYGGYADDDTGLIYFWHRWYDAEDGRWVSRDPIGIAGGMNLYVYALNNGIKFIDPCGKEKIDPNGTDSGVVCNKAGELQIFIAKKWRGTPVAKCIKEHEQIHLDDARSEGWGKNYCKNRTPGTMLAGPDYLTIRSECKAYRAEKKCLEKLEDDCECQRNPICSKLVKQEKSNATRQIENYRSKGCDVAW